MKILKKSLIAQIMELDHSTTKEELMEESIDELNERLDNLRDDSNMFPNGRDFDAEDEEFV